MVLGREIYLSELGNMGRYIYISFGHTNVTSFKQKVSLPFTFPTLVFALFLPQFLPSLSKNYLLNLWSPQRAKSLNNKIYWLIGDPQVGLFNVITHPKFVVQAQQSIEAIINVIIQEIGFKGIRILSVFSYMQALFTIALAIEPLFTKC